MPGERGYTHIPLAYLFKNKHGKLKIRYISSPYL